MTSSMYVMREKGLLARIALCFAVISVMLAVTPALGGCAKTSEDVIREAVESEFDPYKNLDDDVLSAIASIAEDEGLAELGISGSEFASAVLQDFDYTIDDVEIKGTSAIVKVTIISKSASDFDDKISDRVQSFIESKSSQSLDVQGKADEIGNIALDSIRDAEMISEQIEIRFDLQDKTWVSTNTAEILSKTDILAYRG